MVNFTVEQLRKAMNNVENIRNLSVIAHVDHGKTTLTDSLLAKLAGDTQFTDTLEMEKERGITIKSTSVSMLFENKLGDIVVNLIDSPGHVDFSSEVTTSLRISDGALVIVDSVESICVQTETVLRQALTELITPILVLNKIDRQLCELKLPLEEIYQSFSLTIAKTNTLLSTFNSSEEMCPKKGNVLFACGKECWGFSLKKFAEVYSKKFGIEENKMLNRLWGDSFYDSEKHVWKNERNGSKAMRGFCLFVLQPIEKMIKAILAGDKKNVEELLKGINIEMKMEEMKAEGKDLVKLVMGKWLDLADTLIEAAFLHLPSPKQAQKYRADYLANGDEVTRDAILACDPKGPLLIYISKMVPTTDYLHFYAFGRVFSGTAQSGQKARILGPEYKPGSKTDLFEKQLQRIVLFIARSAEPLLDVPVGNMIGILGLDQCLLKTGTITDSNNIMPLRTMKHSVAPVVRVAVKPKQPQDLPKLLEGLKKLSKSDPLVECIYEETGEHIVAGSGELHLEVCLHDLEKEFAKIEIVKSEPVVTYKETILEKSGVCLAKTTNKLNRLFCTAEPLDSLTTFLEENPQNNPNSKELKQALVQQFNWDKSETQKLFCFGPENSGPNILVDLTKGVQHIEEIKDGLTSGFQWVSKESALTGESLRGVRINLIDAVIHSDPVHRGSGLIMQAARRVYSACELSAVPRLVEPVFKCEITVPFEELGGVYQTISQRRGEIVSEEKMPFGDMYVISGFLPVAESFGFAKVLRSATGGKAFPQCVFSHWDTMLLDPYDEKSKTHKILKSIRKRKGMNEVLPIYKDFNDVL